MTTGIGTLGLKIYERTKDYRADKMIVKRISIQDGVNCSLIKMCSMIDSMEFDLRWKFVNICLKFLICEAPIPGVPLTTVNPRKPVDIGCFDITLTCLIYRDPFLYNFLTIDQFLIIFHKSLMYNSFTLLHAKIY